MKCEKMSHEHMYTTNNNVLYKYIRVQRTYRQ